VHGGAKMLRRIFAGTGVVLLALVLVLAATGMFPQAAGAQQPGFSLAWPEDQGATKWYRSPFTATTDSLVDQGALETLAEPGVLLDATAAYDHMSAADTPVLVPEGAYAYVAIGGATFSHDGANLVLPNEEGNIYLVLFRGYPDDATNADLNQIVLASKYVRGTGIYDALPAGAYISLGWFTQQILASYGDPNCGSGCQRVTIVIVDLPTHTYRTWTVESAKAPRDWTRVVALK